MDTNQQEIIKLRQALERFMDCPAADRLEELRVLAVAYQTLWIEQRAGAAPQSAATKVAASKKAPPSVPEADRAVLVKLAQGALLAAADVPRWVWLEDRELIRMAPGPDGREILTLTDLGRAAAGL